MPSRRKVRVHGRVQGVFFRGSAREQAERLGVGGYAVNLPDGTVEVLACGPAAQVDALVSWLGHGPPMARVERLEELNPGDGPCADDFVVG